MPGRRSVKSHENEAVPTQFSEGARGLRGWGASARFRARVYGALSVASGIGGADHTLVSAPGGEETRLSSDGRTVGACDSKRRAGAGSPDDGNRVTISSGQKKSCGNYAAGWWCAPTCVSLRHLGDQSPAGSDALYAPPEVSGRSGISSGVSHRTFPSRHSGTGFPARLWFRSASPTARANASSTMFTS